MAWFGLAKIALQAGTHIFKKRQETKMAMADAQHMQEARQNDWKDEIVLGILTIPILVLAWAVWTDDPQAMEKVNLFFDYFQKLPSWFTNLWILVCASIFGIKGTQIFRNSGANKGKK